MEIESIEERLKFVRENMEKYLNELLKEVPEINDTIATWAYSYILKFSLDEIALIEKEIYAQEQANIAYQKIAFRAGFETAKQLLK